MRYRFTGLTLSACALALSACATPRGQGGVDALVKERTGGATVAAGDADESQARLDTLAEIKAGLTEESAVKIALLNNRSILASLEEVGVARAELSQARILSNPEFAGGSGFYAGKSGTFPHFTLTQDVLELALYPLRRKAGAERFEAARLSVGHSILQKVAHVRESFYAFLAAEQGRSVARAELTAAEAMGEFARRQAVAGNLNELKLARLEAAEQEALIEHRRNIGLIAAVVIARQCGFPIARRPAEAGLCGAAAGDRPHLCPPVALIGPVEPRAAW